MRKGVSTVLVSNFNLVPNYHTHTHLFMYSNNIVGRKGAGIELALLGTDSNLPTTHTKGPAPDVLQYYFHLNFLFLVRNIIGK